MHKLIKKLHVTRFNAIQRILWCFPISKEHEGEHSPPFSNENM